MNLFTNINNLNYLQVYFCICTHINIEKYSVYNIFTTNSKWQVVIGCYWWGKTAILVIDSNYNQ